MINEIMKDAEQRMAKTLEALSHDMTKIRTGRASSGLLDHVQVDYYGSMTTINQVANISAGDARTLIVTPWEKGMLPVIEKAILTSDLGLNPSTSGTVIRVPMPPLTEERRKELIKVVRSEAEQARVSIRNIRRDVNSTVKDLIKDKEISEDDERRASDRIQKITDKFVAEVESVLSHKEKDLMEI